MRPWMELPRNAFNWKKQNIKKKLQCLCIDCLCFSLAHLLVYCFGFPKANHIWKAGDPFTFMHCYISPQRPVMFNCYCRLYFTVAQGCVKEGVFALWLGHVLWNMLFYWFTNASQAESFTIHVTNKLYSLSAFITLSLGPEIWLKLRQEKDLLSDSVLVTLCYMLLDEHVLPFIWQVPVDCPNNKSVFMKLKI